MHNIVVLGFGLASAPIVRQTMRTIVLPSDKYKLYVVTPSSTYHWPIAMPRAVLPGQIPDEKFMVPIESSFAEYPTEKFSLVMGTADVLDPAAKTVVVARNDGTSETIKYDTLIVATGSSARDDVPWKALGTTEKTAERLRAVQAEIEKAKTIVVAGGGMTGIETAGELGFEYSQHGKKEVYYVFSETLPMPSLKENVRKAAQSELDKLKVQSLPCTTVSSATKKGDDYVIELRTADGSPKTITAQAYLPALGMTPNTAFAPAALRAADGRLKQTATLQAPDHPEILIVGDAGNLQSPTAAHAYEQALHVVKHLGEYLSTGTMAPQKVSDQIQAAVTIGRSRGTGQVGSFKLFSILVWWLKGRFLGTDVSPLLPAGKRTSMAVLEK